MSLVTEKMMEQVYRYVPTIGHKRAIVEVAGQIYDAATDSFVPWLELQRQLTDRYNAEMDEFLAAGGY